MGESLMKCVSIQSCQIVCTFQCGICRRIAVSNQEMRTLLRIYNDTFNTVRPREFDGSHLVFPGMNTEMKLRKHQLDFAARVIYTGTGLAAHEVGAGKTAALIAAGMYLKNLGAIHKAVFVVPNPLVGQWATEFYRFFPNANLLVSTAEDFTPKNRNRYISKIATGEYDAVILAHSQFEKIPISTERQIAMLERQINDIENAIYEIKSENGENWSVKQMVIFRKNLDERLKKLSAEEKKDDLLTFEQLGVDMMMVDEAHFFKNCFVFTKLRNVAGITTSSSQRAFDMLLKCQYLQETNQGRGVVFATGTPISNSISELFVMQRYLQPQELERFGWSYFDTWIAHFAKRTSVLELKPEGGGYRMRDRFVRFYNLPELMAVFREVADIKTADMLDIPGLPAVRTGKAEIVSVEATPAQQAIMADFIMRAEAIRTGRVKPEEDNMLKLTGEARLMAIDPRLIRPDADGTGSKLSVCIEDVYQVWKDTAASASTQLVFCDVGTPKAGKFNVYNEIRNVLLAKGVPESEIAFVHDATSEAQRQELFERTRQGKVRILIGSTSKLGTGVNVQNMTPFTFAEELTKPLSGRRQPISKRIQQVNHPKEPKGIRKTVQEAREMLILTGKGGKFAAVCAFSLFLAAMGAVICIVIQNYFMLPVLTAGMGLLPFWYVLFTSHSYKKLMNNEIETGLSIITSSYFYFS